MKNYRIASKRIINILKRDGRRTNVKLRNRTYINICIIRIGILRRKGDDHPFLKWWWRKTYYE